MIYLGFDTSTDILLICSITDKGKIIFSYSEYRNVSYSKRLLSLINYFLKINNLKISDFDGFIAGIGPGSFTGIRIGLSTLFGMNYILKKPISAVSTFEIIGENYNLNGIIVPLIDAKKGEIYLQVFKNENFRKIELTPPLLLKPTDAIKVISTFTNRPILLGNALEIYSELFLKNLPYSIILPNKFSIPTPYSLGFAGIKKGFSIYTKIEPIYIRKSEAETKFQN